MELADDALAELLGSDQEDVLEDKGNDEDEHEEDDDEQQTSKKKQKLSATDVFSHGYKDFSLSATAKKGPPKKTGAVVSAPAVIHRPAKPATPPPSPPPPEQGTPPPLPHVRINQVTKGKELGVDDKKGVSFKQREKRKRDLGQSSRGKSFNEEEKRILREAHALPSGYDT